jgi:uncharacterized protein (TIGR03086 family)
MTTTHDTDLPALEADPRPLLRAAVATGTETVRAVRPDQLDRPTPCSEMDVRRLLNHLCDVLRTVGRIGRGEEPMAAPSDPGTVADDAWTATWLAEAERAERAWADDAALARGVALAWTSGDGATILRGYLSELTVHTWDLATATGQHPVWDADVVAVSYEMSCRLLPGEGRGALFDEVNEKMAPGTVRANAPFGEVVPTPDDAPLIDKLVAWNGRTP